MSLVATTSPWQPRQILEDPAHVVRLVGNRVPDSVTLDQKKLCVESLWLQENSTLMILGLGLPMPSSK